MKIGIVGLGLIGGSLAKAYKRNTEYTVYGADNDSLACKLAILTESMDAELTDDLIPTCDFIFLAVYPHAAVQWLEQNAAKFSSNTIVLDCCGVKQAICEVGFRLADQYGFHYYGGHPMAGTQHTGFKHSREDMFQDASMILVPPVDPDINILDHIHKLLARAGFTHVTITTAEKHDTIIAYTSQLAHVVSNAYVKSPNAQIHHGFSAGSYRDLTRVARLNENMWTELFLDNAEALTCEIDFLIDSLQQYSDAIKAGDAGRLCELLREGRILKENEEHL